MELINQTTFILVSSLSVFFAFWVLFADRKSIINRSFFAFSIAIFFWIVFGFLGLNYSTLSLLFLRLNFGAVCLFFLFTYIFSINYPTKNKTFKLIDILIAIASIFGAFISIFTNLLISNSDVINGKITYSMGIFKTPFYIFVIFLTLLVFKNLILGYIRQSAKDRYKINYFFIGAGLYALFNIIFNVVLPILRINPTQFSNYGDYSAIFFLGFTAYAILKHQLFDIRVVTTEVIVVMLSIALFIQIFISASFIEGFIKGLIWIGATYGGWQLIKSVKKEIKQREELEKLTKQLENANEHLKEMDKLKDDFLSMASHELNTPITAIKGYLSMILEEHLAGEVNPTAKQYLSRVYESAKRLSSLVKDLLNVSRIESGRIHIIYEEAQIVDLIEQAQAEVMPNAKNAGHKMTFEKPAKALPKTWMDKTRIMEILINIMGNAIKYTDAPGLIEASVSVDKNIITVAIKDNGRGIPKDKQESVFNKFSQVDVLKDQVKGTGLGMYISKKFIELMGGKIWFESKEGKGTTFFFTIPILDKKPIDPHEGEGEVLH